jgi:hypothetical protein
MSNFVDNGEMNRRDLLRRAGFAGASMTLAGLIGGCGGSGGDGDSSPSGTDASILGAAKIAEALATTMYTAIINDAPFFRRLSEENQNYIVAARDEEKFHYDLLRSSTGNTDAQVDYFFPTGMFTNEQTTMNVLVTLEDAFIAAYLIGVEDFTSSGLRVLAAQIMGVESDHRTLARLIADDLGLPTVTGLSGSPESVDPPNNNIYERRYGLTNINQVVSALTPFLSRSASNSVAKRFNPAFRPSGRGLFGNPPS